MTWTTDVPHKGDTVYFSHCFPYTYTDLQDYLLDLSNDPIKAKICKQRVLCRTLAGNLVYVLTITSPSQNPEDIKVSNSRVHSLCNPLLEVHRKDCVISALWCKVIILQRNYRKMTILWSFSYNCFVNINNNSMVKVVQCNPFITHLGSIVIRMCCKRIMV